MLLQSPDVAGVIPVTWCWCEEKVSPRFPHSGFIDVLNATQKDLCNGSAPTERMPGITNHLQGTNSTDFFKDVLTQTYK